MFVSLQKTKFVDNKSYTNFSISIKQKNFGEDREYGFNTDNVNNLEKCFSNFRVHWNDPEGLLCRDG